MIKVLLAEDHLLVRAGIRLIIEEMSDMEVIGEADDGQQAVDLALKFLPDILVIDVAMPNLNGLEAAERILRDLPQTKIIVLSMYANEQYIKRALQLGVQAYILKKSAVSELEQALQAILKGERYLSPLITEMLQDELLHLKPQFDSPSASETLTSREREIMQLIAEGHTNQEIAEQLSLSVHTIRTHRGNLMQKLNLHNQAEVVMYAIQAGIIAPLK